MALSTQAPNQVVDLASDVQTKVEHRQRQSELNREVVALLQSWLEDDEESEEEQREALEALKRGIDEHRTSGNKSFA
ncbi:MAG: hypothetical protein QOF33_2315 [Thermomicrobiales bacterium]|jgi:hypothetical protein|nr:hypothetical protein [Thermomicrobiales bacterium]